jgi:Calcineurin-like phosphoesterase
MAEQTGGRKSEFLDPGENYVHRRPGTGTSEKTVNHKPQTFQEPPVETIILVGDHHGHYETLQEKIQDLGIKNTLILHAGDGSEGMDWFTDAYIASLNTWFAKRNCHYWSIRGNHSNREFFQGNHLFPNFKLLPDYSRAQIQGENWLFAGGAVSINRVQLTYGKNWWPEEEFTPAPENIEPCDILLTHGGPQWIGSIGKSPMIQSYENKEIELCGKSKLYEEIMEEGKLHQQLFEKVRPKKWYMGHFHFSQTLTYEGCKARVLAELEFFEHISR